MQLFLGLLAPDEFGDVALHADEGHEAAARVVDGRHAQQIPKLLPVPLVVHQLHRYLLTSPGRFSGHALHVCVIVLKRARVFM